MSGMVYTAALPCSFTTPDVFGSFLYLFPRKQEPYVCFIAFHSTTWGQIYASKLKLHPVVVIGVLYVAEHLVGVQGLIIAVPCAVFVINNMILGSSNGKDNADGDGSTAVAPA